MGVADYFSRSGPSNGNDRTLVIDSFTDFVLNNPLDSAMTFLSQLKGKLQGSVTGLVLLEQGVHPENVTNTVEYIVDGTVRTRFDESGRHVMVSRMLATPVKVGWWEFTIEKGIDLILGDPLSLRFFE